MDLISSNLISTVKLWPNQGQISGLPANPRFIRDERYEKLVKSIKDHPEMLFLRELIVVPHLEEFVVIAGNMRLRAANEIISLPEEDFAALCKEKKSLPEYDKWLETINNLRSNKKLPCKIVDKNTSTEQLRAYTIKDNVSFGSHDYDLLANEWNQVELEDWGMELPVFDDDEEELPEKKESSVVRLVIEFEGDLSEFDEMKKRVEDVVLEFPDAKIK